MMHYFRASAMLYVLVAIQVLAQPSGAEPDKTNPIIPTSSVVELRGRHPELVQTADVANWIESHGVANWYETPLNEESQRTVVIQGEDDSQLFAALVDIDPDSLRGAVERLQPIDTRGMTTSKGQAESILESADKKPASLRPVVTFLPNGYNIAFEAEVITGQELERLRLDESGNIDTLERRSLTVNLVPPGAAGPEELTSNELHHADLFKKEAEDWTNGATNTADKVRILVSNIYKSYTYDEYISRIGEFTWSDSLVRDLNGRKGICDEFSVVLISHLRALGIPARHKLLVWYEGSKVVAHACAEFQDSGIWRHADACWNKFDEPECYRRSGAANLTVIDADHPLDSRSTEPCWGVIDLSGDLKLNPYDDFILTPPYPGRRAPRYSF